LVQETRGWVEERGITVAQRSKEYAHDYRYFPEPDLPPLTLSRDRVEAIRAKLPELPDARRKRFMDEYGLPLYDANLLTSSKEMADYEEVFVRAVIASGEATNLSKPEIAKLGSNWLLNTVSGIMNVENVDMKIFRQKVSPENLARVTVVTLQDVVNTTSSKYIVEEMFRSEKNADDIISQQGLNQISDTGQIEEAVSQAIAANAQAVADYKAGKESALKFLVGQVMKGTGGRANPQMVGQIVKKKLEGE
ncbi:MAG: Asp-tRNA(Asn)/Glu-tRNA(Gln) amidotransferase GatCAB subunit B, partial [Dehalococcoidales bacterium]